MGTPLACQERKGRAGEAPTRLGLCSKGEEGEGFAYSALKATTGSTFAARLAGRKLARTAVARRPPATPA